MPVKSKIYSKDLLEEVITFLGPELCNKRRNQITSALKKTVWDEGLIPKIRPVDNVLAIQGSWRYFEKTQDPALRLGILKGILKITSVTKDCIEVFKRSPEKLILFKREALERGFYLARTAEEYLDVLRLLTDSSPLFDECIREIAVILKESPLQKSFNF